jgi:hypothetical protein
MHDVEPTSEAPRCTCAWNDGHAPADIVGHHAECPAWVPRPGALGSLVGNRPTIVGRENRERWAKHAAIQAIDLELERAEQSLAEAARYVAWVQGVQTRRRNEIAAGEWPPKVVPNAHP